MDKNFVVKKGLEVGQRLIYANDDLNKIGIGTTSPQYSVDIKGDLALSGKILLANEYPTVSSISGIVSSVSPQLITGINTSILRIYDVVTDGVGGFVSGNTQIIGIGISNIQISPQHTKSVGLSTVTLTITRNLYSGNAGDILVSRGNDLPPAWKPQSVISFAATSTNVIGGIASVTQLSVSGVSTFNSGIFSGSTSTSLVRITQAGTGNALTVEDAINDTSPFVVRGDGYVGIGTTNPTAYLTLNTNSTTSAIKVTQEGTGNAILVEDAINDTSPFVVRGDGYVGIGTTNPTAYLTLDTNSTTSAIKVTQAGTGNALLVEGSTPTDLVRITQTGTGNALVVEDSANPDASPFVINKDGKVGINTIQPNYSLDVRGNILFGGPVYTEGGQLTSRVGILSGTNRSIISGINTSGIEVSDFVDNLPGTEVSSGTVVTSIGNSFIGISPDHLRFGVSITTNINIRRIYYAGNNDDVLVSRGSSLAPTWSPASSSSIQNISTTTTYYPTFAIDSGRQTLGIGKSQFAFIPNPGNLGIGSISPTERLDILGNAKISGSISVGTTATVGFLTATNVSVAETVTAKRVNALTYFGDGVNLAGIVTQITAGIGANVTSTQNPGKGVVNVASYFPTGKTIYVAQNGDDSNTGLTENNPKRTIKAAAGIAVFGDTIKVYPGVYIEENPVVLKRTVSVQGTELRNCMVTPKYPYLDLFHVNNGCHITNLSFVGPDMTDGAAVVALQPLNGVAVDRYFDAARMIRFNLDYIASETVGYLTSTSYKNPTFKVVNKSGIVTDAVNCSDDIKDIWKCVIHDITRGGNSRSVGAGLSYYSGNTLVHIAGTDPNGYSVRQATVDAIEYSFNVARAVVNNVSWGGTSAGSSVAVTTARYNNVTGITTITATNHGLVKDDAVRIVGLGFTCPSGPGIVTYPSGTYGYIFNVLRVVDTSNFEVIVGQSTLPHTYVSGGTVQKYTNFQNKFTQVKDLGIQKDPLTGFNNGITGCANVISAMKSCVGIVTNIVGLGSTAFTSVGIRTSYPGNSGIGFTTVLGITSAVYDAVSGKTTITAPGLKAIKGESIELRGLSFSCSSGGGISTQSFPSGRYGYDFFIDKINNDGSFDVYVGPSTLPHTYAGGGVVVNRTVGVTTASYVNTTGITTIQAKGLSIETGDLVRIRGLEFSCPSGSGTTTIYPTGKNGYDFKVLDIVVDKQIAITSAVYSNTTGITTITAPGIGVTYNGLVELRNLQFSCPSGAGTTTLYPTGNNGYKFRVLSSIGSIFTVNVGPSTIPHTYVSGGYAIDRTKTANDTFTINVGPSTIPHTYVSGGIVIPPFSRGTGPITQGPYVRNSTNFIPKSIGMKVDGFAAEPGDKDDIGVTGTMSVDSYTQYNQGGIGVSISNGAYAQLVSIFTICDDIGIYTEYGGQCDITNSNCSFGNYGLYSNGIGGSNSKSIYRYTGVARTDALLDQATVVVSGVGNLRPYDGQALYFGEVYYQVNGITVTNGGSGYTQAPLVTVSSPTGPNGIRAEASANIDASGRVTSIDVISTGNQYRLADLPTITIASPPSGTTATAVLNLSPIYYTVESATLPSAGISTVILSTNLNNTVGAGTTVYFTRLSLQLATSISLEWVGSGTDINTAKPALGGVAIQENEVFKKDGGQVVYTSTNQAGNFQIGDEIRINQLTGTISGRAFNQSILNTVTPLIIALGN